MKQLYIIVGLCLLLAVAACKKSEINAPDNSGTTFKFISLVAKDTLIKVNGTTSITANATGENLTYKWTSDFGTFIGSGKTVQWTVCHSDIFTINCQVTDKNNQSESKNVTIRTEE
ncbi:MAG: hypothetical protein M0Q38_02270 [Bacteroidales bacterium]|jgi:hypothetical protein|nr:hypothetical protein [Bacteroidales bacterium]